MPKVISAFAALFIALASPTFAGISIAMFGSSDFDPNNADNVLLYNFTTTSQTETQWEILGNDLSSSFYINLPTAVDITGHEAGLLLTATLMSNVKSTFQINLFDNDPSGPNFITYQASFGNFTQNISTSITLQFVSTTGSFNGKVAGVQLLTDGLGSVIDIKLGELQAIPEPSVALLLGISLVTLQLHLRHRRTSMRTGQGLWRGP